MTHRHSTGSALTLGVALVCLCTALLPQTQAQDSDRSAVERGEYLFTDGYKCYACHGFDAQTGERRLVPLNYNLPGFTALVQNSPFPQMPSYNDVPAEDLADIFAYIQAIPPDAPALDEIEVLSEVARQKRQSFED